MINLDKNVKKKIIRSIRIVSFFIIVFTMTAVSAMACTTVIIGKDNTVDGSVMLAHSEDLGQSPHRLVSIPKMFYTEGDVFETYSGAKIPQPRETYAYIASKIFSKEYNPGDYTSGINEYQVSVANNASSTRDQCEWEIKRGGVFWSELTQLVLERCKNSREGVELIGHLCEEYGWSGDSGTILCIADPNEGWIIEIPWGGEWIAHKVPDDGFDFRANAFQIGEVDLNSPDILHSENLVKYAVDKGWYNPDNGPFNFAKIYGDDRNQNAMYNTIRQLRIPELLTSYGKVSREELISFLRSCYEGTSSYKTNPNTGSPFELGPNNRPIPCIYTAVSCVAQLRSWLPAEVGRTIWWSFSNQKATPYVPWYFGAQNFSKPYTKGTNILKRNSAYWQYKKLSDYVHSNYSRTINKVNETWSTFEGDELNAQESLEMQALDIYEKSGSAEAAKFLNKYSNDKGNLAYETSQVLLDELKEGEDRNYEWIIAPIVIFIFFILFWIVFRKFDKNKKHR